MGWQAVVAIVAVVGAGVSIQEQKEAKEWGADMMLWHVKEGTSIDSILPRLGYGVQDIVYSKTI